MTHFNEYLDKDSSLSLSKYTVEICQFTRIQMTHFKVLFLLRNFSQWHKRRNDYRIPQPYLHVLKNIAPGQAEWFMPVMDVIQAAILIWSRTILTWSTRRIASIWYDPRSVMHQIKFIWSRSWMYCVKSCWHGTYCINSNLYDSKVLWLKFNFI